MRIGAGPLTGLLTPTAALLLGVAASGHCLVMCGGISSAVGLATAKNANGRPYLHLLAGYQLGRITSYALAGLLVGGMLGGFVALLDVEAVRRMLRLLSGFALLVAAAVAFGGVRDFGFAVGRRIWPHLAPLGRRLLPVRRLHHAFAFGMLWGWMPCGFVYTVLLLAALTASARDAALMMFAFGLGTAPAMFAVAFGAQRLLRFSGRIPARRLAGIVLVACALLTIAGPWLPIHSLPWLHGSLPSAPGAHSGHGTLH